MDIDTKKVDQAFTHVRKLFEFLSTQNSFILQGDNHNLCQKVLSTLRGIESSGSKKWNLNISPNLLFTVNNDNFCGPLGETKIAIGGFMKSDGDVLYEHSIAVSFIYTPYEDECSTSEMYCCTDLKAASPQIVRRFHFDFDSKLSSEDRPISHLQYGGKFNSQHIGMKPIPEYKLFKAIDHPRLPLPPYDLTLIIDMFLSQIPTDTGILRESSWPGLISRSEDIWLKTYYEDVLNHMNQSKRRNSTYQHLCKPLI